MAARPTVILVLLGALGSLGAGYRTQNFVVEAATPQIAQQVGQYAEYYRKQKALEWLGQEMPPWGQPCPLRVTISMNGSGGATSFAFDRGRILSQEMNIEGRLDRLLASVLPHEITHTVFAHYFRAPVPRWADEGGSVLSEDDIERRRHDMLVREILRTPGRAIPIRRLFSLMQYPPDVMVLYAEGYSVTSFLVEKAGRSAFLAFVGRGMRGDWDGAARTYYGFQSVQHLEQAWLQHLRDTPPGGRPADNVLAANPRRGPAPASPAHRVMVRQTVPPTQPLQPAPRTIYRGQTPDSWNEPVSRPKEAPLGYLPDYDRQPGAASGATVLPPPPGSASVRLGAPQFEIAPAQLGQPIFGTGMSTGGQP